MKAFLTSVFALVACLAMANTSFEGTWHGELSVGSNRLPLVIHIPDSVAERGDATLDSPLQGAYGIAASITINERTLLIQVPAIGASYSGELSEDRKINGTFEQSGMRFPLILEYGPYIPQRPQTPKPPYPYNTSEVSFVNPIDGAVLSGTLTMPLSASFRGKQKSLPVVLMVTGSGQQNRDEELFGHKPFAVIAHNLALHGIASLRYDDRGYGKSTGSLDGATTTTFAQDAAAGLQYLRDKGEMFSAVGVLGHSEGGDIAYLLAAQHLPDFIISIAGPSVSGEETLLAQNKLLLEAAGYPETRIADYLTGLKRLYSYLIKHPDSHDWMGMESACADLVNLQPQDLENYKQILKGNNRWLSEFIATDPQQYLKKMDCPCLVIYGSKDMQVPADMNAKTFADPRLMDKNVDVWIYPGLNHLMQTCATGLPSEYGQIDETISETVMKDIVSWIKSLADR